jgi:hypothetical protein
MKMRLRGTCGGMCCCGYSDMAFASGEDAEVAVPEWMGVDDSVAERDTMSNVDT